MNKGRLWWFYQTMSYRVSLVIEGEWASDHWSRNESSARETIEFAKLKFIPLIGRLNLGQFVLERRPRLASCHPSDLTFKLDQ